MYLKAIEIDGFRAAVGSPIAVEFPGRFSLLVGSNGVGKTTVNDAIYLAHPDRFPRLPAPDAAVLGAPPRTISVAYSFESDVQDEGALGAALLRLGERAPTWTRSLERSLGRVRARTDTAGSAAMDQLRLIYLPALRNPVDELSRRETRVLLELLRAEQLRSPASSSLADVRRQAEAMLASLTTQQLLVDVHGRIAENMKTLTAGVSEHFPFIGTQRVDDAYLARVLEFLLATTNSPQEARRLEASSLGYVNLLHIAVTLAGVPDPSHQAGRSSGGDRDLGVDDPDLARQVLEERNDDAEDQADSFFPQLFHATILIEEPEAHLHPQLQHGLIRYLRRVAADRPDLQVIVSTHASEIIAACKPHELVIMRRDGEAIVSRTIANAPWKPRTRKKIERMTALHLDASRSSALFADRVVLVEGITEVALLRAFGRAWAGDDPVKSAFVDALAIVPMGNRVGEWPIRLLAEPGFELATQVAVLADTDARGTPLPEPSPPAWHAEFSEHRTFRAFWSRPTLEPSLVEGNESLVEAALSKIDREVEGVLSANSLDQLFRTSTGKRVKAEFAFELAAIVNSNRDGVDVPDHIADLFDWLWTSHSERVLSTNDVPESESREEA